jgi:hypothetical protein
MLLCDHQSCRRSLPNIKIFAKYACTSTLEGVDLTNSTRLTKFRIIITSFHTITMMLILSRWRQVATAVLLGLLSGSAQHLRSIPHESSPCNDATDQASCWATTIDPDSSESCVWCKCQAIPSECLTPAQAAQVPPGVFDCSNSSSSSEPSFFRNDIVLVANPVDSDVCDVHSKSGYLSVKGSQYDENGEDKHLFYWMFDKRNSENDDSQEDIPFVVWLTGGPGCSSTLVRLVCVCRVEVTIVTNHICALTFTLIHSHPFVHFLDRHSLRRMDLAR